MSNNRPISPHLQIYKLPVTALISITHRITGVFLITGLIGFLAICIFYEMGEHFYNTMQTFLNSFMAKIGLFGFFTALGLHTVHGIRHLIWDLGKSFTKEGLQNIAFLEIAITIVLSFLIFAWII